MSTLRSSEAVNLNLLPGSSQGPVARNQIKRGRPSAHLLEDGVQAGDQHHSEHGRGVCLEAELEDVAVAIVAAELGHEEGGHEVEVVEGREPRRDAGGLVEEEGLLVE